MSDGRRLISRRGLILINLLIALATVLAVAGMFAVWANRQLLNPDNWSTTSTQLLQNASVRDATTNYLVDRLYATDDIAGLIKSGLPKPFRPLAGPAAGALRNAAAQSVKLALVQPPVQNLWARANRRAAQALVTIINGGKGPVNVNSGVVTLDLASVVGQVAERLGLPTSLSSKLPASVANLEILRSNQLKVVQDVGRALKGLALWLTIIVPVVYGVGITLGRGYRRRILMSVGFSLLVAGALVLLGRSILQSQIPASLVKDASVQPAASAVVSIGTSLLSVIAGGVALLGALVIVASWFAGPASPATAARRAIAPFLRENPGLVYATTLTAVALIIVWRPIPATGKPAGLIVFMLLALVGTAVLRRETAAEFPDAQAGDSMATVQARMRQFRQNRQGRGTPATETLSAAEQLERLAALRDRGAITPAEYDTAKNKLLGTTPTG